MAISDATKDLEKAKFIEMGVGSVVTRTVMCGVSGTSIIPLQCDATGKLITV